LASKHRKPAPRPRPTPAAPARIRPARYRIELKRSAERDLAALEHRDRLRVARKIDALANNPRPPDAEKLKGPERLWRIRAGDYRVIYTIRNKVLLVLVIRIGHRREVYRRW
jgi:mRNA interferase RelE/StbE